MKQEVMHDQLNALHDRIVALEAALADSARNPVTVSPVSLSLSDPATGPQVQVLLDSHNQLISALVRS